MGEQNKGATIDVSISHRQLDETSSRRAARRMCAYFLIPHLSRLDDLLRFCDAKPPAAGCVGVKVPRRSPEDEVAPGVGLPRLEKRNMAGRGWREGSNAG